MTPTRRVFLATSLLASLGASSGASQLPPLTVPKGRLRADITASFTTASERLRNGTRESLAADFVRAGLGSDFFAGLEPADSLLRQLTGLGDARIDLGASSASQLVTTGVGGVGLAYGMTDRLTVFGHLPIHRVKVRSTFGFDGANGGAGFNPADPTFGHGNGQAQTAAFFTQFDNALNAIQNQLATGGYDHDPTLRALAEQTVAAGTTLRQDLHALLLGAGTASYFLPLATSTAGAALLGKVTALQSTIAGPLMVNGFSGLPALPATTLSAEDFDGFLTSGAGPIAGTLATPVLNAIGDIELGAAYALADRLPASGSGRGYRLAAQGLVRLRTSRRETANRFFDVGTGERQPDVEFSVVGDGLMGRLGVRARVEYTLQLSGRAQQRIGLPGQPVAFANRLAAVTRNPGEMIALGLTPFVRLAETFALTGGAVWRRKAADQVTLLEGQEEIPGAPPALLAEESDGSWTTATVGFSFSFPSTTRNGAPRLPIDAGMMWEGVVGSSGPLRVPKASGVRLWLRLYR